MAIEDINDAGGDIAKMIIKRSEENKKYQASNIIIDTMEQRILQNAAKQGMSEDAAKAMTKSFDALRKAKLEPSETMAMGKMLAPDIFQDDLTRAIKQSTLQKNEAQNASVNLPQDLTPLGKEATPEEKSAFLDKLPPELAQTVQGFADYSLDPTKVASMRTGERQTILAATKMFDPSFDMKKYPAQADYVKQLSRTENGTVGAKVNSANTLISHLGLLSDQVDKLKNTNLKPANAIINLAKDMTGDTSITDFQQAKSVVDSELETLLTNVGATQQGLEARRQLLSDNASYDQMKSSIQTIGHILQARTRPLEQQYEQLFNKPAGETIIHADSRSILQRIYSGKSSESKSYSKLWS